MASWPNRTPAHRPWWTQAIGARAIRPRPTRSGVFMAFPQPWYATGSQRLCRSPSLPGAKCASRPSCGRRSTTTSTPSRPPSCEPLARLRQLACWQMWRGEHPTKSSVSLPLSLQLPSGPSPCPSLRRGSFSPGGRSSVGAQHWTSQPRSDCAPLDESSRWSDWRTGAASLPVPWPWPWGSPTTPTTVASSAACLVRHRR